MFKKFLRRIFNPPNFKSKIFVLFLNVIFSVFEFIFKFLFSIFAISKKSNEKLFCIYDLTINPLTFDFIWFLFSSESKRIIQKKKSIELILITGSNYSSIFE